MSSFLLSSSPVPFLPHSTILVYFSTLPIDSIKSFPASLLNWREGRQVSHPCQCSPWEALSLGGEEKAGDSSVRKVATANLHQPSDLGVLSPPHTLMLALQSQWEFPGRKKLLVFYYLLQQYKRRGKALLRLRSMASLVVEGH